MMTIEQLIHIMKNDYGFTFRVYFGLTGITVDLMTSKSMDNPKEKVIYFMNTLFKYGLASKRDDEEEETIFTTEDGGIRIRISD